MQETVTWTQFAWVIGGLGSLVVGQLYAIWKMFQTVHSRVSRTNARLDDLKVDIAKNYVSASHLIEVETRMTAEIHKMRDSVERLTAVVIRVDERVKERDDRKKETTP